MSGSTSTPVPSTGKSGSVRVPGGGGGRRRPVPPLLTHAQVLLAYLVPATGISEGEWLDRMRADYVDRIPSSGTGVWGPHELRLGS